MIVKHATEEQLSIFESTNGAYDVAKLKPLGSLVVDSFLCMKENLKLPK